MQDEQEAYRVMEVFLAAKTQKIEAQLKEQSQALLEKDNAIAERDRLIEELKRKLGEG